MSDVVVECTATVWRVVLVKRILPRGNQFQWESYIMALFYWNNRIERYVQSVRRVQFQQSQESWKWKVATIGTTFNQRSPLLNQ